MDKSRSPRYPNIPLSDAIAKVKMIYAKEHMSPASPPVVAEAMGYSGLNGASLKVISSLKKYGLLEGRGEDLRLSKDGQTLAIDDSGSPEYREAIRRSALNVELFTDLKRQFPTHASDRNISIYLEKQGFKPEAASITAKNYRETMALVEAESGGYSGNSPDDGADIEVSRPEGGSLVFQGKSSPNVGQGAVSVPVGGEGLMSLRGDQENDIKVLLDGNRLRVAAWVDIKGLRKLKKILDANAALLEPDDDEGEGA